MSTISKYLKQFVLDKNMSERQFALSIDMSPTQFNKYINGINVPGERIWKRIKSVYPDFDIDYDTHSHGMIQQTGEPELKYGKQSKGDEGFNMMMVPLKAYGGFLAGYANRVFQDSLEYSSFPFIKGRCYAFEVDGFSMYPELIPGDYIVCTDVENPEWLSKGKIYVFITIDGIIIKKFIKIEGGFYYLESENKQDPQYAVVDPIPVKSIKKVYYKEYIIKK